MNFLCSYTWLQELVPVQKTPSALAMHISLFGPSVERVHSEAEQFAHMVVGKINAVTAHPKADKLRVVEVDIGKKTVSIVCGGSNLEESMKVAVALPGSFVKWHGEGELIQLSETEIRGVSSFGMICGADEIGLSAEFPAKAPAEIVDLSSIKAKAGTPLADALGYTDTVFDIEVTSNRVDMMSMLGIAREVSAIEGIDFTNPETPEIPTPKDAQKIKVTIKEPDFCLRYTAVRMDELHVGESPLWMKKRLLQNGIRPINVIVDIGNYVMLETGQPLHAFDGAHAGEICVRGAKKGERLLALDGKTYELSPEHMVIANGSEALAVAGIMGGETSGITEATTSLMWEAATFDGVSIRGTARALGLYSDAQLRFEKKLPEELAGYALARAVQLTQELAGGKVSSLVFDSSEKIKNKKSQVITCSTQEFSRVMGVVVDVQVAREMLTGLGFVIEGEDTWRITVPYWRTHDIKETCDIVEEVARMYGYHAILGRLPHSASHEIEHPRFSLTRALETVLVGKGFFEAKSFSMISGAQCRNANMSPEDCVTIANPLSEEGVYMRPSLVPSMLTSLAHNTAHEDRVQLFEIASVYKKTKDLPEERATLCFGMFDTAQKDTLFFEMKGICETIAHVLRVSCEYHPAPQNTLYHGGRTAEITIGDRTIGMVGEIHPQVLVNFGIETRVVIAEFFLDALAQTPKHPLTFKPLPEFPGVKRDLALILDARTTYAQITHALQTVDPRIVYCEVFDVYQGEGVGEGNKSMALHLEYRSEDKTLTADEAESIHGNVLAKLQSEFGAKLRM